MTTAYLAKTFFGLEEVLAQELRDLGATNVEVTNRAVSFEGDKRMMYKANYCLRTALRILQPIHTFKAKTPDELYKGVQEINWSEYLLTGATFAIDSVVHSEYFNHSKYVALRAKDALVDQFREVFGFRPNVHVEKPDVRINIRVSKDEFTVSLDSSGESLHKRGYRMGVNMAPLNEVLAAGMILLSDWDRDSNFVDFMCGSGTLPIEAAMIACNIPPAKQRDSFGFMTWQDFDQELWDEVKEEAVANEKVFEHHIIGSDLAEKTIDMASVNVEKAEVDEYVRLSVKSFTKRMPPRGKEGIVIINPPYGERLDQANIENFYKLIGDHLKNHYTGYDAWVISSNKEALKYLGLRTSKKLTLFNGALECKYQKYELYKGSKKSKHN